MCNPRSKNSKHQDYNGFLKLTASLMSLSMLAQRHFEVRAEISPHQLQFDCRGSVTLEAPYVMIEGDNHSWKG